MLGTLNIPNVVNETAYGIDYDGPLPEITTELKSTGYFRKLLSYSIKHIPVFL